MLIRTVLTKKLLDISVDNMTRWHEPFCNSPSITTRDGQLHCINCNADLDIDKARASDQVDKSAVSIPPDEPAGQLNLWWPPSVPYMNISPEVLAKRDRQEELNSTTNSNLSLVYEHVLAEDEFRLACLNAPWFDDFPIHLSLETYKHIGCPEYETVSYTWGGEEGDNTVSEPVFIGPFWDVSLQTRNCWAMLKSIRPRRGIRMIWVDALCINQHNAKERGEQVNKMKQIYEECERTIIYLGPDIETPLESTFPRRSDFESLADLPLKIISAPEVTGDLEDSEDSDDIGDIEDLEDIESPEKSERLDNIQSTLGFILQRRYFSRVWVIQELIMSSRSIVRIGDTQYSMDSATPLRLNKLSTTMGKPAWHWPTCAAPWFQYMAQKEIQAQDLYHVLAVTSKSRATDLRDRLFGVIGVLQRIEKDALGQPNYSLSAQHVFIGLLAHLIINLKRVDILLHASTLTAPTSGPSWAPLWRSDESWQSMFTAGNTTEEYKQNKSIVEKFVSRMKFDFNGKSIHHLFIFSGNTDRLAGNISYDRYSWLEDITHTTPWDREVAINSVDGTLSIYLTHICVLPSHPMLIGRDARLGLFEVEGPNSSIYLASQHTLDSIVIPGHDHIFMLTTKVSKSKFNMHYLVLRATDYPSRTNSYRIVGTCLYLTLGIVDELGHSRHRSRIVSLYQLVACAQQHLNEPKKTDFQYRGVFPGIATGGDMFPAYHGLVEKDADVSSNSINFQSAFISCVDVRLKPEVEDGFFQWEIRRGRGDTDIYIRGPFSRLSRISPPIHINEFERLELPARDTWRRKHKQKWTPIDSDYRTKAKVIQIRVPISKVEEVVRHFFAPVDRIRRTLKKTSREVEEIMREEPKDEYRSIGCPDFPEMEEGFGLDCSTFQVHIH